MRYFRYILLTTWIVLTGSLSLRKLLSRLRPGKGMGSKEDLPESSIDKSDKDAKLKKGIAKFYDESSSIWLRVWGENMHHGYYPLNVKKVDHKAAQIDMIDRSLEWAYGIPADDIRVDNVVDVGCGVGGSSRHIAKKYGASGVGISLSPFQIETALKLTKLANLTKSLDYVVGDALAMPFGDNSFDLTWSMESGEHMPDKAKFMSELVRVTAPGGRIIVVTWCHRELQPNEQLTKKELKLLKKINDAYYLPDWVPASHYVELANELGLDDVRQDDWSTYVDKFWPAVIRSALVPRNTVDLIRSGRTTLRGAIATLYMMRGFQKGLIKFALITGKKKM